MASNQHTNLWAEKLMQVSLPDSGEAWASMEALLDKEAPRGWKRDRRRWLLLALLLLLLIGVCNCPGRGRLFRGSTFVNQGLKPPAAARVAPGPTPPGRQAAYDERGGEQRGGSRGAPSGGASSAGAPSGGSVGTPSGGASSDGSAGAPSGGGSAAASSGGSAGAHPGGSAAAHSSRPAVVRSDGSPRTQPNGSVAVRSHGSSVAVRSHKPPLAPAPKRKAPGTYNDAKLVRGGKTIAGENRVVSRSSRRKRGADSVGIKGDTPAPAATKSASVKDSATTPGFAKNISSKDSANVRAQDSLRKQKTTPPALVKNIPAKDSVRKKRPPPPPVEEEKQNEREHGWMAGIGLNQFFPLGGQQSAYNSSGTGGTLGDYIPVPMIRYYFNHRLYIQLEAQINTPQATKKNLVITSPPPDTATIGGQRIQKTNSASIQKLFYFNVPLSVHYEPFDNLDIGAGLQFSRLTNAVGAFDSTVTNVTAATSTSSKAVKSFKGDTLYQRIKTNELRFLVDVNYTYKHWVLGLRYNQALSKFIHVEVAPGQITQSRNSSLQLYLRYILWDGRKKKPVAATK